jgi:1-aminocyclopropane-1-carboxylate deaminase/D-cysteine desulfhydrase-like pyridoxal-dependent ACC family enzyme
MTGWSLRLESLPRLSLLAQPTPLICAERLSAAFGGPRLWFKRDDLVPAAFGGNKVRSLEIVVADALGQGAETLVTGAGPLSNHVRASAGVAALAGLRCIAIYWGPAPTRVEGNHRLTEMLGADIRFTGDPDRASVDLALEMTVAKIAARGGRPYIISRGGACALATLAHVLAVRETLAQCADLGVAPGIVVMAVGGGATFAGWLLGSALFGASWRIEGITVSRPAQEALTRARNLAAEASAIIDCPSNLGGVEFSVHDGFIGDGYGLPSREGREAILAVARTEGLFLDPVYTGKAMAGYRTLLSQGRYEGVDSVLFLHTGGAPTLFTSTMEASL